MPLAISGFSAYLGMLDVDVTHNHPIVKTFVALSWQTLYENYPSKEGCDNPALEVDVENEKSKLQKQVMHSWNGKYDGRWISLYHKFRIIFSHSHFANQNRKCTYSYPQLGK